MSAVANFRAISRALLRFRLPGKLLCFHCRQNSNTSRLLQTRTENGTAMKIHEYQAKTILSRYGVTTPRGEVAFSKEEAREAAHRLRSHANVVVVKAQIHAGGRGKAGGVKLAHSSDEAADIASHMLGMKLVTPQTGPAGRIVKRLLIEEGLEINPCVLTGEGKLVALDAKMAFDDNALFRHKDLRELRDLDEEDPLEVEASKYGLNYIKLDGSVACMVNGAGLAMATMDIIKYAGGSPANFLDVGGGASAEQVKNAFRILMSDPEVKAVFINIFGGILRCDVLATGVVSAAKELHLQVPVVIRMEGTNVEAGQKILRESGLNFTIADGMKDGAQKVVK